MLAKNPATTRRILATLTRDDPRRNDWSMMFGAMIVPLMIQSPIIVAHGDTCLYTYAVKVDALSAEQFSVFRCWCAENGYDHRDIARAITGGFLIAAEGVVVIEIDPAS